MAYKFQHGQAILSGALDQEGSIDIKDDGSGEFELKHDGNTILNSSRALGNVTSISGSTSISGRDLVLDVGGKVGISTDTDLLTLTANQVAVAGKGQFVNAAGQASALTASARVDAMGLRIDTGGVIGTAGDNDLLTLNNGSLVIAGAAQVSTGLSATGGNIGAAAGSVSGSAGLAGRGLTLDVGGSIGITTDTDLIALTANNVAIAGALSASTRADARGLRIDTSGIIGTAGDNDLLTLNNGSLLVTGQLTASVAMSASLIQCTTLEVGAESIKIGSTTINETELAGLDGITAGTVAASKAVIVDSDKDITGFRNVTATGAFVIGNASMAEADLEQIDGITAGTVAASKAVVVDANKDASGFRNITAASLSSSARSDAFGLRIDTGGVIGTAGDTDLLTLNNDQLVVAGAAQVSAGLSATGGNIGAAAGSVSGSAGLAGRGVTIDEGGKLGTSADADLVQLDANKVSVAGVVSGSQRLDGRGLRIDTGGVIGTAGDTDLLTLNNGSLVIAGAAQVSTGLSATGGNIGAAAGSVSGSAGLAGRGLTIDTGGVIGTAGDADLLTLANGVLQVAGEVSSSGDIDGLAVNAHSFSINNEDFIDANSNITAAGLSGSGNLLAAGTVRLDGVAAATIAEGADFFYILDADDNLMKKESVADVVSGLAGDGIKNGANKFALDLNELTAAAVDVANDSIAIVDANDSNLSKKESIADLVSGIAGSGLNASAGVLSIQSGEVTPIRTDGAVNTTALVEGYNYMTGSASKSVTLPASPSVGDVVVVKAGNLADGEKLTVARAGSHTIDGLTSVELESDYAAASFVYLVANNWGIV